jgi:hypothetical protein
MLGLIHRTDGSGGDVFLDILVSDVILDEDPNVYGTEIDWSSKYYYLSAGDTIKLRNNVAASRAYDYYFSILEQS